MLKELTGMVTVSRKTPGDGKLLLPKPVGERLAREGATWSVNLDGAECKAILSDLDCTCRGPEEKHVHYFLESERFKHLPPYSTLHLVADPERKQLTLTPSA
jgi:hypothetical protein